MPYHALAVSTSDAVEPIITENECSLTVSYRHGGTVFSGVQVKLYRIAEVSADLRYTLTQPFESSGLVLDEIKTSGAIFLDLSLNNHGSNLSEILGPINFNVLYVK